MKKSIVSSQKRLDKFKSLEKERSQASLTSKKFPPLKGILKLKNKSELSGSILVPNASRIMRAKSYKPLGTGIPANYKENEENELPNFAHLPAYYLYAFDLPGDESKNSKEVTRIVNEFKRQKKSSIM